MSSPLFQFELLPLHEIEAWGAPDSPSLHWFGLSLGRYWIQAGEVNLFEYGECVRSKLGVERFCTYQVARLYEDVIEMSPYVLEPIPSPLRSFIAVDPSKRWNFHWRQWSEFAYEHEHEHDIEVAKFVEESDPWLGRRVLDSAYLTPSANIHLWSDDEHVHIQWDNREKLLDNEPAWAASVGSWSLTRAAYEAELRSFHFRFMRQMDERVQLVAAGALDSKITIDTDWLRHEHQMRASPIERNLSSPAVPTDWSWVARSVRLLEQRNSTS